MPVNITDVSTFTDPITAPAGADARTASSVADSIQKLANRTRYLLNQLIAIFGDIDALHDPVARTVRGVALDPNTWTSAVTAFLSTADDAFIAMAVPALPPGSEITSVVANVDPGAVRSPGARMSVSLLSQNPTNDAVTTIETQEDTINTTSPHAITLTLGAPVAVDSSWLYHVSVRSGTDAPSGHAPDRLISVVVHYTAPRVGD
jgi:hypothetical protein